MGLYIFNNDTSERQSGMVPNLNFTGHGRGRPYPDIPPNSGAAANCAVSGRTAIIASRGPVGNIARGANFTARPDRCVAEKDILGNNGVGHHFHCLAQIHPADVFYL